MLWTASLVGHLGGFFHTVAASWLMLELTGSAVWVGLMAGSSTLPVLVFALPAGVVADLFDRRKVLFAAHAIMAGAALAMSVLWFAGLASPLRLLVLGLVLGTGVALNLPVSQAIIPDLVPRGLVAGAMALSSAGFNVARAVGPTLGGVVVVVAGPGVAFALNALSYVITLAAARSIRGESVAEEESSIAGAVANGLRYVRFTAPLGRLLGVVALFAFTSAALQAILPNLTHDRLGGGAGVYGVMLGAMGVGALLGTAGRERVTQRLGAAMVPVSVAGVGLAAVVVGWSTAPLLTGLAMAAAGACWIWVLVTLSATAQLLAPTWVRGRVMSIYSVVYPGFVPLGAVAAGGLADLFGTGTAMVTTGLATVALGVIVARTPLPAPDDVRPPETMHEHLDQEEAVAGSPVLVTNTWRIEPAELEHFFEVMDQLRVERLRSGGRRWWLYREAGEPTVWTEAFMVPSWEDHLRQHRRTDPLAARLIERTRGLDAGGGPATRHMVGVAVKKPHRRPRFDQLAAARDGVHDVYIT